MAYDLEHNGVSAWFNKQSGDRAAEFGAVPERTQTWFEQHEWRIDLEKVAHIINTAESASLFLCGGGANEDQLLPMCDRVIWLQTDEATIRQRVHNKRDHTYGLQPHELAQAIQDNVEKEVTFRLHGAKIIDGRQPLQKVVNEILNVASM